MLNKCYWITGLPASGKTSLGKGLVNALIKTGRMAYLLDGDGIRKGLCSDLTLSDHDRSENIRRAGEVAKILWSSGVIPVCAFVSPFERDRSMVRALFHEPVFQEIYLSTSLSVCQKRDPKGLYALAANKQVTGLTGFDAPYEKPLNPEFEFNTDVWGIDEMINAVLEKTKH